MAPRSPLTFPRAELNTPAHRCLSDVAGGPGVITSTPDSSPAPDIVIDEEIRALIPPPSADERAALERQLLAEGCRDALTVWAERHVLLDGHTRLGLCRRHGLPYRTTEISLPSREAAIAWVLARQGGRRNLTPEGRSYVRGRRYLRERRPPGGTGANQHGKAQGDQNGLSAQGVLARLAGEYQVSAMTLKRDARFASDVDAIAANCGEEVKGWVLTRDARLTRRDVARLALLGPADQREVIDQVLRDGRVVWPSETGDGPRRLTVPAEAEALAQVLVRRLGRERAAAVFRALGKVLDMVEQSATAEAVGAGEPP